MDIGTKGVCVDVDIYRYRNEVCVCVAVDRYRNEGCVCVDRDERCVCGYMDEGYIYIMCVCRSLSLTLSHYEVCSEYRRKYCGIWSCLILCVRMCAFSDRHTQ